jgi:hypothetical protein
MQEAAVERRWWQKRAPQQGKWAGAAGELGDKRQFDRFQSKANARKQMGIACGKQERVDAEQKQWREIEIKHVAGLQM